MRLSGSVSPLLLGRARWFSESSMDVAPVQGGTLTASREGKFIRPTDGAGGTALVTAADVAGSNGLVHVIDTVVMPPAA